MPLPERLAVVPEPLRWLMEAGGPVLILIMLVATALFALMLERWWYLRSAWRAERRALMARWVSRSDHGSWSAHTLREARSQALIARLHWPLPWMRLLVAICPLLGLLGTVTGMIAVFDGLAMSETHQARTLADGVARATLPTLAGMAVAVVGLLATARLERTVRREKQRLRDRLARAERPQREAPHA